MGLGRGAVITDVAYSFPIVLSAEDPRVYVITVDGDFDALLADPLLNGVSYALLASPDTAPADAVAERYPGMWEDGAGRAEGGHDGTDPGIDEHAGGVDDGVEVSGVGPLLQGHGPVGGQPRQLAELLTVGLDEVRRGLRQGRGQGGEGGGLRVCGHRTP